MDLKRYFRGPFVALLVVVMLFFFVYKYASSGTSYKPASTSQVISMIQGGQVKSALLIDNQQTIQITPRHGQPLQASWVGNQGTELANMLQVQVAKHNLPEGYNVQVPKGSSLLALIVGWLPFLLVILIFLFLLNQMQGGGSRVMNFGKSKAKLVSKDTPKTTFADIAGADEAIEELQEIKEFLQSPAKFQAIGAKIPKGVLLYGPPGTGKTLLARAVAGEAGVPFYSISGSDFVEMFVGVGASRVRDLFEQAKANAPAIVFVDEIDAVGRHRGAGLGGGHDEREQTLNQMLVELDGFDTKGGVIVIAATNRPDILDPALLRPGRFDRQVYVTLPDIRGREQILNVHMRKVPLGSDVRADLIARGTPGFSGADLANLVNEAALFAARRNGRVVEMIDFEKAKDKIIMGTERKSMVMDEDERRNTAYHEAGHALIGKLLPKLDPIHKVTIIPRGGALGVTVSLPEKDRYSTDKVLMLNRISMLFGGRIAEEVFMNQMTTGASNDFERATSIARDMVMRFGMSDAMGPMVYSENEGEVFLGRSVTKTTNISEETMRKVDAEVRRIIDEQYAVARKLIEENKDKMHAMANALLEWETIDTDQVKDIMEGKPPRPPKDWTPSANKPGGTPPPVFSKCPRIGKVTRLSLIGLSSTSPSCTAS
jgi:cell division protease FtsH